MTNEHRHTLRLLLTGLAAGDSLGSSSEFTPQSQIPALYAKLKLKGWPFAQVGGGAFNWKPGAPTDDTDQAMCLIRSFVERGKFDPEDVAKQLVGWLNTGPRDVGGTTMRTLAAIRSGKPWHRTGLEDWQKHPKGAANGALMRNGVLAGIMFGQDLNDLFRATVQHTIITHGNPLAVLCSAAHSWIIADLLSEWGEGPIADPDDWLDSFYGVWTAYVAQEEDVYVGAWLDAARNDMQSAGETLTEAAWDRQTFDPFKTDFAGRDGYCLLTLQIGVWALLWSVSDDPFPVPAGFPVDVFAKRGAWVAAWPAMIGHDSDTYGAVAGSSLAAAHGSIPASMVEGLEALAEFDAMLPPQPDE